MLKLIANRATLIHRASEQAEFALTVEIGEFLKKPMMVWMETALRFDAENPRRQEFSKFKITSIFLPKRLTRTSLKKLQACSCDSCCVCTRNHVIDGRRPLVACACW